jgi:hypothetical protein
MKRRKQETLVVRLNSKSGGPSKRMVNKAAALQKIPGQTFETFGKGVDLLPL